MLSFADTQPLVPGNPLADENRRLTILAVRRFAPPAADARERPAVIDELREPLVPPLEAPTVPKAHGRG